MEIKKHVVFHDLRMPIRASVHYESNNKEKTSKEIMKTMNKSATFKTFSFKLWKIEVFWIKTTVIQKSKGFLLFTYIVTNVILLTKEHGKK